MKNGHLGYCIIRSCTLVDLLNSSHDQVSTFWLYYYRLYFRGLSLTHQWCLKDFLLKQLSLQLKSLVHFGILLNLSKRMQTSSKTRRSTKSQKDLDTTIHIAVHRYTVALRVEHRIVSRVKHYMVLGAECHDTLGEKQIMACAMEFHVPVTQCLKKCLGTEHHQHIAQFVIMYILHSRDIGTSYKDIFYLKSLLTLTTHLTQKYNNLVPEWQKSQLIHKCYRMICVSQGLK